MQDYTSIKGYIVFTVVTYGAYIVMMRKLLTSFLGGWLIIGLLCWGLLSLASGREISIMFYSLGYASLTVLLFSLVVKFLRMLRSRPVRTLQPATIKGASHA